MKNSIVGMMMLCAVASGMMSCGGNVGKQKSENVNKSETRSMDMPGIKTFNVGDVKVTWIKDNAEQRLMPVKLFASAPKELIDSLGLQDGIPASVSAYVVETDGKTILFDTGNGNADSQLINGLKSAGLSPDDIDYIYLTHFHGDHIGGMMKGDSIVFKNAKVYASKVEYDGWMAMSAGQKAGVEKVMSAYKDNMVLFEFGDTLPGGVVAMNAVGHTPGHTAYKVGGLLVVGDLLHGKALQTVNPEICASYDMDTLAAVKTRRYFFDYARENNLVMVGMHFPESDFK